MDDLIIKSIREEDHPNDLKEVFGIFRENGMKLNPNKCAFRIKAGKFLGFMVSEKEIEANPKKVQAILDMQPPKSIKEV